MANAVDDKAAADKAAADTAAAQAATDKAAADKAASDKAAADAAAAAAGTKPKDGEAVKDGDKPAEGGAPATYALTVPEGGLIEATELAAIEQIAREHNLTNEAAQAVLEQENARRIVQSETFAAQLTADRDYGGAKLADTQRLAKSIIDRVRPEGHPRRAAFQRILEATGYGNNIEIASFLADLGKMASEDSTVLAAGGAGKGGDRDDLAKRMYPNQK